MNAQKKSVRERCYLFNLRYTTHLRKLITELPRTAYLHIVHVSKVSLRTKRLQFLQ